VPYTLPFPYLRNQILVLIGLERNPRRFPFSKISTCAKRFQEIRSSIRSSITLDADRSEIQKGHLGSPTRKNSSLLISFGRETHKIHSRWTDARQAAGRVFPPSPLVRTGMNLLQTKTGRRVPWLSHILWQVKTSPDRVNKFFRH
jgi:hypothetical protein